MLPATSQFGPHEPSDLYHNETRVKELLRKRGDVAPEVFNQCIAEGVVASKRPPSNTDSRSIERFPQRGFSSLMYNNNYRASASLASTDSRLYYGGRRSLEMIKLPQAVIDRLGYKDVQSVADWVRQGLPIGKRINWDESKKCMLETSVQTSLVAMNKESDRASVGVEAHGYGGETWIYLSYSLSGNTIGEAVVTYPYKGTHIVRSGRIAEQNKYRPHDQDQLLEKLATVKPLQETWDTDAIADATLVTIGIKLWKATSNSDYTTDPQRERSRRQEGFPVTYPTDLLQGRVLFGYDGKFTLDQEHNYMSVSTAIGVDFASQGDHNLACYFDTLCKKVDSGLDEAETTAFGPTAEKVKALMLEKLNLPSQPEPKVTLLEDANSARLDFTGAAVSLFDSDGKVCIGHPVAEPLPTTAPKQAGLWWENYPQVIRFYTEKDVHLPPEQRVLKIFNYDPKQSSYVEYVMTYTARKVLFEDLQ